MTVDDFKEILVRVRKEELIQIVDDHILAGESLHVSQDKIEIIRCKLRDKFRVDPDNIQIWIVGSAKFGFSISEKRLQDDTILPRYRPFSPGSDIDVAVVCPAIFEAIWYELSGFAHLNSFLPWDSKKVGDYLINGWWRLDQLNRGLRLGRCDDWKDCFRELSADHRFGRRTVNGGIFYSKEFLVQYQLRAVKECKGAEELL